MPNEPKHIIQLTINIYIDGEGNVALSNTTAAQSNAPSIYPKRVFCPDCGMDLKYADSESQLIRKIAAHKRGCPGTPEEQILRERHENIFYPKNGDLPESK